MRIFIIFTLMLCLFAGGCAKKTDTGPVRAEYYPACHEPLAYLHQRSGGTGQAVAKGAIQSGVISGIAGAIIGAIAGGIRPAGILTGVGVGAALGGTVSGLSAKSAQTKEDNRHMAAYLEQIDGDIDGLDIVSAAATVSMQCYGKEFNLLLQGMQNRQITREASEKRFAEIMAGREEAARLLNKPADAASYEKQFNQALKTDY